MLTLLRYIKLLKKRTRLLSIMILKMVHRVLVYFFKLLQLGVWIFAQIFSRMWPQVVFRLDSDIKFGWCPQGSFQFSKGRKLLSPFMLTRQQFKDHEMQEVLNGIHKKPKKNL